MSRKDFTSSLKFETDDIRERQTEFNDYLFGLSNSYLEANSFEVKEYLSYLSSAIYLEYKRMYPDLSIYIPFRIKSDNSASKNIPKEFSKSITEKYNGTEIDLSNIDKDFVAATVVLDHIKNSRKTKTEYISSDISELRKLRENILAFVNDTENILENDIIDEEQYMSFKLSTLKWIIESTYPECENEREIPYSTELAELEKTYDIKLQNNNFIPIITEEQVADLKKLLLELRSRSSDKLEFEILRETFPAVLNSPLLKNALMVNYEFEKDSKKPNGFVALYYSLQTPFGVIEMQLQTNKRYYEAKKGSAFHSGVLGKEIDITSFFELVDPNDNKPLSFYLSKLDNIPADKILSDIEIPNFKTEEEKYKFLNSPDGENYKLTLLAKEYMSHIRIKDNYTVTPNTLVKKRIIDPYTEEYKTILIPISEIDEYKDNSIQLPSTVNTNNYLLSLAKSISPFMGVCSSGHTSFSTASIHQKDLVGEFTEILRKKDSTSCLANLLTNRLRDILKTTADKGYHESRRLRDRLPRDIAKEDIAQYAVKLHEKINSQNINISINEKESSK